MTLLLVLTISHVAAALIGCGFGAILGAERVRDGVRGGNEDVTGVQCAGCRKAIEACRCPMRRRVGRA